MRRRHFLKIAATALLPLGARPAQASVWRGQALGADLDITLTGRGAEETLADLPPLLRRLEGVFSLYHPSELTRLNATGHGELSPWLARAFDLTDQLHAVTGGVFDPTVQPLWRALAEGGNQQGARAQIGWHRLRRTGREVTLDPGQALTFNGLAQGLGADLVRDWLRERGFEHALVNLGEYAALGGPFRLGIEDPDAGVLGERSLTDRALAVSAPTAMTVGGQAHILHPKGQPARWSSVAVETDSAALADGLSTALVFADAAEIRRIRAQVPQLHRVTLVNRKGDLWTV
ncbi:FAD:protein FMN transferase [Gemmobacter lanyuensis]|uniref:FAD:protein FMN transferase n=1 Tax=Gemmobacter lanyuensis TaxID=1054497 RepID=A0A918MP70_9RHOB|nr:FAD:protein FMN transferase [Gemmobacter lanyuensis]GGW40275.1 FAD:protein FMN transferase [Gemmobacter lanyuensis]